jgi:hypothetical protein
MQAKYKEVFYATVDLKRLAQRLVDVRLSDDARKLVVIAIASEPPGVAKQSELSKNSNPANERALELLEARDFSRDSLKTLEALIREMSTGHRARNHSEVQNRRLTLTAKYIRLHADDFFYEDENRVTRSLPDADEAHSQHAEECSAPLDEKKG